MLYSPSEKHGSIWIHGPLFCIEEHHRSSGHAIHPVRDPHWNDDVTTRWTVQRSKGVEPPQDMLLQCEGVEPLPLPPSIRAIAAEAFGTLKRLGGD